MNKTVLNWELITRDNAVFTCYVTWSCILVIKVMLMSLLTGFYRFKNKVSKRQHDPLVAEDNKGLCLTVPPGSCQRWRLIDGRRRQEQRRVSGTSAAGPFERHWEHFAIPDGRTTVHIDQPQSAPGHDAVPNCGRQPVSTHHCLCHFPNSTACPRYLLLDYIPDHFLHAGLLHCCLSQALNYSWFFAPIIMPSTIFLLQGIWADHK